MSEPIGCVTFGPGRIVATLVGEDDWSVSRDGKPDPVLARSLTALYAGTYHGPQDGHYGQWILDDLAGRTGGTMTIRDFPPAGPDETP